MRGFYVGRFQPFHYGHYNVIENISEDVDEIVVAVGSAQESHSVDNPFTGGERISMITKSLEDIGPTVYSIPIEDINRNSLWVSHVQTMCPPFDRAYTNNPLVMQLFEEEGIETKENVLFERDKYSGTKIRTKMLEDEEGEYLVPEPTAEVIEEINGVERLKKVSRTDEPNSV